MVPYGIFIFSFSMSMFLTVTISTEHDFRYISFQDLQDSLYKFSQKDAVSYSQMLFDVAREQVVVGARDVLFRLSLRKLDLLETAEWVTSNKTRTECINKGQSDEFCHNYIKILLSNGTDLFTCGTYAFSPRCSKRKIESISNVIEEVDSVAKCPHNPDANVTGFISEQGEYYFGGPTDFSSLNAVISKNAKTTIKTKSHETFWLNDPQFVGSFETENFVYFLFREAAVEYMNCGKSIYSRIARVCKNDVGSKEYFTTFIKARLNCSISGKYPFYFDEIQSMSYISDANIVYATFTTPSNSIAGSAICAFNLTAIEAAFAGPFKHQENMDSAWKKVDVDYRDHFNCKSSPDLLETSKYKFMDSAVQPTTLNPLHVAELERFTHITVDVLSTKVYASFHVIYVATTEGVVKKISVLPRTQQTCIVEVWQVVQDTATPIKSIQFLKETKSVYIATDKELLKIPADHCNRHSFKKSCLESMDPYCGWNEQTANCSTAPDSNPLDNNWQQFLSPSCPKLDRSVDGGWSSWSSWSPCIHRTSPHTETPDNCLCQTRECNNPFPKNGGQPCSGPSVAVINCTVHGGWSEWSEWSACSATCGVAFKTRKRTCTNPAPEHGGRVCVGQDRTEVYCQELPPCLPKPQDGGWSSWSGWSECIATDCGEGYRKRSRTCDNPVPNNGGQLCTGNNIEIEHCTKHGCSEHKKYLNTEWYSFKNNSGEYRRRYRFVCKAPVKHVSSLKLSLNEEFLDESGHLYKQSEHSKWGSWSSWGECSVPCGGGLQNKTRQCEGKGCQGSPIQTKECNKHPCQGEWGCWSEWSPCNASCGWGVKLRYRTCLGYNCTGPDREKQPCENAPCDSLLGWSNWTVWSLCDKNDEQHRKRQCRTLSPGPKMCQGSSVETRMCIEESNEVTGSLSQPAQASVGGAVLYFVVGLAFFVVGGLVGAIALHYYEKKKKTKIPSSPHWSSKQNPYITVPLQERPSRKHSASTSENLLNTITNGTLKSSKHDYETVTLKRNNHASSNGHIKNKDLFDNDKFLFD